MNFLKDKSYKPMRFKELCMMFNVPRDERSDFKHILDTLISEGIVSVNQAGRFVLAAPDVVTGVFSGTMRGFGFVRVEGAHKRIYFFGGGDKGCL